MLWLIHRSPQEVSRCCHLRSSGPFQWQNVVFDTVLVLLRYYMNLLWSRWENEETAVLSATEDRDLRKHCQEKIWLWARSDCKLVVWFCIWSTSMTQIQLFRYSIPNKLCKCFFFLSYFYSSLAVCNYFVL